MAQPYASSLDRQSFLHGKVSSDCYKALEANESPHAIYRSERLCDSPLLTCLQC